MTLHLLHLGSAILCWSALAVKLVDLAREPRSRGLRILCVLILGLSIALTAGFPPIYVMIDRLTSIPNAAKLIQHLATIGACTAIAVLYVHLDQPGDRAGAWRRIGLAAGVGAGMTWLFFLAPVDVSEPVYFADRFSMAAYIPQYMFLFLGVIAVICVDITVTTWRQGRRAAARRFRHSARLISASAATGVVYAAFKALYIIARFKGVSPPIREGAISSPLALAVVVLAVAGLTIPKAGNVVSALRHRLGRLRSYRHLYPLWSDLHAATPEIALHRTRFRFFDLFDIEYLLYRRVIEISDGILASRAGTPPNVALARAVQRHQPPVDRSLEAELHWLTRVADAYQHFVAERGVQPPPGPPPGEGRQ